MDDGYLALALAQLFALSKEDGMMVDCRVQCQCSVRSHLSWGVIHKSLYTFSIYFQESEIALYVYYIYIYVCVCVCDDKLCGVCVCCCG